LVQEALKKVIKQAKVHELITPESKVIGIIEPHNQIYRAFVSVSHSTPILQDLNRVEIKGGKYAAFKVRSNVEEMFHILAFFYGSWLLDSGYKIADVYGFEIFSESPESKPYNKIEREIFVPIEAA
jgi:DNA gyrase inhibitor GyrI